MTLSLAFSSRLDGTPSIKYPSSRNTEVFITPIFTPPYRLLTNLHHTLNPGILTPAPQIQTSQTTKHIPYPVRPTPTPTPTHHPLTLSAPTMRLLLTTTVLLAINGVAHAGPIGYGICQAGCAAVVMACYGAAGFTWGATAGATAPASIVACNSAFGTCQAACAAVLLGPTP